MPSYHIWVIPYIISQMGIKIHPLREYRFAVGKFDDNVGIHPEKAHIIVRFDAIVS